MDSLKWLWKYLKNSKWKIVFGLLSVTIFSFLGLAVPYYMGLIVDRVIEGKELNMLDDFILAIIGITLLRTTMAYGQNMLFEIISQRTIFKIRNKMYHILNHLDFKFYDTTRTGDIMSRMTGDLEAVRHFIAFASHQLFKSVVMLVFAIVMMFAINVKFAIIILLMSPLIFIVGAAFANHVRPRFSDIRKQFSRLNTVVQENVSGNRVVKAFAKEPYEMEKFEIENQSFKEKMLAASSEWEKYLPVLELGSQLMFVVVILAGGIMVISGSLSYGELVMLNTVIWRVSMPLRMMGWLINDTQRFVASSEKVINLMNTEPVIKNEGVVLKEEDFQMKGKIEFKDVFFRYKDSSVLNDVSFTVQPGETVAFIGATGSGKSTIMNLICRFYEADDGLILLDRINVKKINLKTLRSKISIAMQDVFLFTDTIEGNIAYGVPDATIEDVKRVAKLADAHAFIEDFPEGYDTIVGERGVGLSGGQKQRIALARTLIKDPQVLILDDTTSSLDMETEHKIQKTLEKLTRKRTTLIIAHRISSVKNADKIFVMENGSIAECGTHEELLIKEGIYFNVYKNQLGDFDKLEGLIDKKEVG